VASTRLRVAAGAGLIAASWTIVGPTVAAASAGPGDADRGHSKADKDSSKDSSRGHDRDHGDRKRSANADGRHARNDDQHRPGSGPNGGHDGRGGQGRGGKSDGGGWKGGTGSAGSEDTDDTADSDATDVQLAGRPASAAAVSTPNSLVAAQSPPAVAATTPEVAAVVGSSGGGSGGAAPPAFVAPTVSFGDGRTPGFLGGANLSAAAGGSNPSPDPAAPAPVPSALEQWAPAPAVMPPTTMLSELGSQPPDFIDQMWAPLRPTFPGGLAFGITGLLIAPLAGVWLGYRQARASQTADQLVDR
jgi:hypothetical protein